MRHALVRGVSPAMSRCELTHREREPIDIQRAEAEHRQYVTALKDLGCRVHELPAEPDLPDSVFVEDTAVIVGDAAVITWPGAASRRPEIESICAFVGDHLEVLRMGPPATLDGGDVLRVGRTLYVGASGRTNTEGITQLRGLVTPRGYNVVSVAVAGCLHLKSAVTEVGDGVLLANRTHIDVDAFVGVEWMDVDLREPDAANALRIGDEVLFPAAYPRTAEQLRRLGIRVRAVDVSELAKAEGAVTCCSLIWDMVEP